MMLFNARLYSPWVLGLVALLYVQSPWAADPIIDLDYSNGPLVQRDFDRVQWLNYLDQTVTVRFREGNRVLNAQSSVHEIRQLDSASQNVIHNIRAASERSTQYGDFKESGQWLVYLSDGQTYTSAVATGGSYEVENHVMNRDLENLLSRIRANNEAGRIEDIEYYHVHMYNGEPLSPGDNLYITALRRDLQKSCADLLSPSANLTVFAVGLTGEILFRYSVRL